jgi:hypothetical protein
LGRRDLGLEPMQARRQRCPAIPDLLGADAGKPDLATAPRIVQILVSCQAAISSAHARIDTKRFNQNPVMELSRDPEGLMQRSQAPGPKN